MMIKQILKQGTSYLPKSGVQLVRQILLKADHLYKTHQVPQTNLCEALNVALILAQIEMGTRTIIASAIYYTLRKTSLKIKTMFPAADSDTRIIIEGLDRIDYMKRCYHTSVYRIKHSINFRRLLLAVCPDIRTIIIELARQLDICRHLPQRRLPKAGKRKRALKTFYIYTPIAGRLGIETLKWRLQDIAFHQLHPQHYEQILTLLKKNQIPRMQYIKQVTQDIKQLVQPLHLKQAQIYGRPKHIYSIYHKQVTKHKQFQQIYDFLAVRVITMTIQQCYAVLGILQSKWHPIKSRFKDYIAKPKANLYQSLHTTVIGPEDKQLEIQIRTHRMHQIDEYGVAAHWAYKRGIKNKVHVNSTNRELNLFKQMITMRNNSHNPYNLKSNLFNNHVYVFTPNRDVIELPAHSVPLDMAYHIHTEVGNHAIGAKVNGEIVSWDYHLNDGDRVSIITSAHSSGPSQDWLRLVASNNAKHKIKHCLRKEHRGYNIAQGKDKLIRAFHDKGLTIGLDDPLMQQVRLKRKFPSNNKFFEAIGLGQLSVIGVIGTLTNFIKRQKKQKMLQDSVASGNLSYQSTSANQANDQTGEKGIIIAHSNNFLFKLSHCCYPLPGDSVVGYITKNQGISIHRTDCPKLKGMPQHLVKAHWANQHEKQEQYLSKLKIWSRRQAAFVDVLHLAQSDAYRVISIQDYVQNNRNAISLLIKIANLDQLKTLMTHLRNINSVYRVIREFS